MHEKFAAALIGVPSRSISADQVDTWAKIASKRFVDDNIPLNQTIQKIAEDNDLNPNFVERICESANLQTHASLIPREPEKRAGFAFPLADAKTIVIAIGGGGGGGKHMCQDFAGPPSGLPDSGPSMADLFGVSDAPQGHNGFDLPEKKKTLIIMQKKAALRKTVYDKLLKTAMLCEDAELRACQAVGQAVMHGDPIEELYEASCYAGLGDVAAEVFDKTARALHKKFVPSMDKVAFKAPEELIDRSVPMKVINGRNPIIASLDTLKRYHNDAYTLRLGLTKIDDEMAVLSQKIREME